MAKKKIQVLLWDRGNSGGYYKDKLAYYYTDLKELMNKMFAGDNFICLSPDDKQSFYDDLKSGKVLHTEVEKNYNGNKDDTPFGSLSDGDFFTIGRITKDSERTDYQVMDTANISYQYKTTYCKFEQPKPFNEEELSIIEEAVKQALDTTTQDNVFNLFAWLCATGNHIWDTYSNSKIRSKYMRDDKRERTYLGFETMDLYHEKDVETRERVAKRIATCAELLTKQLTGYELKLLDEPEADFVEGLMASRYLENDKIQAVKVCEPTLTPKELFQRAVAKTDVADGNIIAAKVCLPKTIFSSSTRTAIEYHLPLGDVKQLVLRPCSDGVSPDDFTKLDNCLVCLEGKEEKRIITFTVYIWDDLLTTYELAGNTENFIKIIKNQ